MSILNKLAALMGGNNDKSPALGSERLRVKRDQKEFESLIPFSEIVHNDACFAYSTGNGNNTLFVLEIVDGKAIAATWKSLYFDGFEKYEKHFSAQPNKYRIGWHQIGDYHLAPQEDRFRLRAKVDVPPCQRLEVITQGKPSFQWLIAVNDDGIATELFCLAYLSVAEANNFLTVARKLLEKHGVLAPSPSSSATSSPAADGFDL